MSTPRSFYEGIATLTGCVIGAGILGIPYAVSRAGFWTGILVIVALGIVGLIIHLMAGEIALRTKSNHQLVGLADRYMGKTGKMLMTVAVVLGSYGAMVAYTIGVSEGLAAVFGGTQLAWLVGFYAAMTFVLYGGLSVLQRSELMMESVKLFIFFLAFAMISASRNFNVRYLTGFSWNTLLIPYGVVLFAYIGAPAIPEVREELKKCAMLTKKAIIAGSVIPIIVYVLFAFAVIGVSGSNITEVATIGLVQQFGGGVFLLLHIFAILALMTSFIAIGFALKRTFIDDYHMRHLMSWLMTMAVPAVIIFFGAQSFVRTLDITGIFAGGAACILIVLMHWHAKKKSQRTPEYVLRLPGLIYAVLVALFAFGMLYGAFTAF